MSVSWSNRGAVALVRVDNPPVNAVGQVVRDGLLKALDATEADDAVQAVVLACAGRTFIAGADIREFDKPLVPPMLPDVLVRLETARKPWVAAIHGTALGGGLETALACSHRIAARDARMGLPEVTLGLIPGGGGTVRLPRLVDPAFALKMITGGKPVGAEQALAVGLIDALSDRDLLDDAIALALRVAAQPRPVPLAQRAPGVAADADALEAEMQRIDRKAGEQQAPKAAVSALRRALTLPAAEALMAEREAFLHLRTAPQAKALRHVFFAERNTARIERIKDRTPRPFRAVGVIGGGTMGAGIAASSLLAGLAVQMVERDDAAAEAGRARVLAILQGSLSRGLIDAEGHALMLERFDADSDYGALANADLVIEAVFEDMAVKLDVLTRLDAVVQPGAVLATNTSYLDVNALAAATRNPTRVIGLHFFSPAHIMKLLEIVVPDGLGDDVLATAVAFARKLRKIPVLAGVCDGFIANRIMSAYRREGDYMLEDGAMPWDVDAAMKDFGFPMGLFQMQDLAGLGIGWAMRKRQAATRDPAQRYVEIGDRLCEAGHFGRKTGRGYYVYDAQGKGSPSPETEALILSESARRGIARVPLSQDEIMARILSVMQAEAQRILDEGIARCAEDIDVVMINAFGFPRWRGGPMFMAQHSAG